MNMHSTALVIGASRGIGRACARSLAAAGWRLRLVARRRESLAPLTAELGGEPHRFFAVDLTSEAGRNSLMRWLGDERPATVIQCLGGRPSSDAVSAWSTAMDINFHAVVATDELLLEGMLECGRGTIVHLSSSAAIHGKASAPYAAAKAAVNRYIVNRGRECLARGVSIIGLMPAAVEGDDNEWSRARVNDHERYERMRATQILGRPQTTDEVAAVVTFLCSPAGLLFGGCVLPADAAIG